MRSRTDYAGSGGSAAFSSDSDDEEAQLRKLQARMCGVGHQLSNDIVPRPRASPGYWLCCLVPLALGSSYWSTPLQGSKQCSYLSDNFKLITTTAASLCIQNLSFFLYLRLQAKLYRWLIVFVPFLCGACLFRYCLGMTWWVAVGWTLFIDVVYQRFYIEAMRKLPMSFTYGEASILTQGVVLFVVNTLLVGYQHLWTSKDLEKLNDFQTLNIIMMFALLGLLIVCLGAMSSSLFRNPFIFYPIILLFIATATLAPITNPLPIIAVFEFIFRDKIRLFIILFYVALVGATVAVVCWQLQKQKNASTRVRKLFHVLIVLVYIPGLLYECEFLYIASGVALALVILFDLLRILHMPPLGEVLEKAFHSFADEKDAGIIAFTPMCLLIGCSLPMWIMPCPCQTQNNLNPKLLALLAGILTIGFGDTAASVFGSKYGRTKWKNSSRSVEGSMAFILYVLLPIVILNLLEFIHVSAMQWLIILLATIVSSFVEARTDQIDNLILPLVFYIIVNLC